jgi:hypothetical protein
MARMAIAFLSRQFNPETKHNKKAIFQRTVFLSKRLCFMLLFFWNGYKYECFSPLPFTRFQTQDFHHVFFAFSM